MAPWPSYGYIKSGVRPEVPERHGPEESYPWLFWKTSKSATAFVTYRRQFNLSILNRCFEHCGCFT